MQILTTKRFCIIYSISIHGLQVHEYELCLAQMCRGKSEVEQTVREGRNLQCHAADVSQYYMNSISLLQLAAPQSVWCRGWTDVADYPLFQILENRHHGIVC